MSVIILKSVNGQGPVMHHISFNEYSFDRSTKTFGIISKSFQVFLIISDFRILEVSVSIIMRVMDFPIGFT